MTTVRLAPSLALLLTSLAGPLSPSRASGQEGETFRLSRLAPDVYAALVVPEPPSYAFANSLIVVGADGVLVVDTQQSPSAARALIREIRRLTDGPVRWVVNTHWHGDHVYGNQVYADSFPGVVFIAHRRTRAGMEGPGRRSLEEEIRELPATIEQRERWLSDGRGPDGATLTDEDRAAIRRSARLRREYLAELRALRLVLPSVTFERRLSLWVGERRVQILHLGPAHTPGDLVVHLPVEGVLAAGDLVEDGIPWVSDASPAGWARALARLQELGASRILPSHGPVLETGLLLRQQLGLFRELSRQVDSAVARGLSLEETLEVVDLTGLRADLAGGDSRRERAFDEMVETAVERAWREAVAEDERRDG